MQDTLATLPPRRRELILRESDQPSHYVVKDPTTGDYFQLGPEESFLLLGLDGTQTREGLRARYEARFGRTLSAQDLDEFIDLARQSGFLEHDAVPAPPHSPATVAPTLPPPTPVAPPPSQPAAAPTRARQSLLYWRKKIFDPDALFSHIEPLIRFVWTPLFFALAVAAVLTAAVLVWANGRELVSRFSAAWGWEALLLAWFTLGAVTAAHESAHGLTCKHFGGEVREIGFLLLFFTPCFYCNVSDAWLIPQKSKRLWITFAGGFCDIILWSVAVFVWRLTPQDSLANYVAFVVLGVCGARILFNFNHLLKLDGYYLLSDYLAIPNLQQRSFNLMFGYVRQFLWGAPAPDRGTSKRKLLLAYGVLAWLYSIAFLSVMLLALARFAGARMGWAGVFVATTLGVLLMASLFKGTTSGEFAQMFFNRRGRTLAWAATIAAAMVLASLVDVQHEASAPFQLRPARRVEIYAPVTGFLRSITPEEADPVGAGATVALMEIPDLDARTAAKHAEMAQLQNKISAGEADQLAARQQLDRLYRTNRIAERDEAKRKYDAAESQLRQFKIEVVALEQEAKYLDSQARRCVVNSPIAGVVVTPHLREKQGQYLHEGDLICVVETPGDLVAEIKLAEQDTQDVRPGQTVRLKARALPFTPLTGQVQRIAPSATPGDVHSTDTVYCRVNGPPEELRSGMTGYARIQCGPRPLNTAVIHSVLKFVRTEFWW